MRWLSSKMLVVVAILAICTAISMLGGCVVVPTTTGMEIDLANAEVQVLADKCQDANNPTACEDCKAMVKTLRVKSQRLADIANGRKAAD